MSCDHEATVLAEGCDFIGVTGERSATVGWALSQELVGDIPASLRRAPCLADEAFYEPVDAKQIVKLRTSSVGPYLNKTEFLAFGQKSNLQVFKLVALCGFVVRLRHHEAERGKDQHHRVNQVVALSINQRTWAPLSGLTGVSLLT